MSAPSPALLAIDAGLRAGLALYDGQGRLLWYRSRNYGSQARLRKAAYTQVRELEGLAKIVVEGGGGPAEPWLREGDRREIPVSQVHAHVWRELLLLPRDRRTGSDAKDRADTLARRVIDWSDAPRPTSLRHDAAEAILLGLWAVIDAGWLPEVPAALR